MRQLRQLIGVWESSQDRIELCVTFFNRIVDPWNAKLYRGRLESFNDLLSFKRRVGMARSFPYIQRRGRAENQLSVQVHGKKNEKG